MPSILVRALSLCLAAVLLAGCTSATGADLTTGPATGGHPDPRPSTTAAREPLPEVQALRVLRAWDRRRAAAYAAGEPSMLRRLYARGSRAEVRDVDTLRAYADRGLVVEGITVQVLRARVLARSPTVVRLRLVDRITGATAVVVGRVRGRGERTVLPVGRPVRRVVTLVRAGPAWVVRSVRRR